jgi:anti-sigma B factor antagonist
MKSALAEAWTPTEPDIMDVAGRLDDGTAQTLEEDALLCIQSGARRLVLDCRDLSYVTAAGLRTIAAVARAMKQVDGVFALCELQPQVEQMLDKTGFLALIPVFGSRHEAIRSFAA